MCSCLYCKKEFSVKGIFTHYDRTHCGSTKYSNGHNQSYTKISENAKNKKSLEIEKYNSNPKYCNYCNTPLSFNQQSNNFCSHSCSAKFNHKKRNETGWTPSLEQRKKVSEKLSGRKYIRPYEVTMQCVCGINFSFIKTGNKNRKFCSKSCAAKFSPGNLKRRETARNNRSLLENYRQDCAFKFSVKNYPEEFELSLIETHGWYKAKNKGNNLTGVSRDHIISVRYGFDNNVDPAIISHPANCRLLQHNDNVSKGIRSDMTLDELKEKIRRWDQKYKKSL